MVSYRIVAMNLERFDINDESDDESA